MHLLQRFNKSDTDTQIGFDLQLVALNFFSLHFQWKCVCVSHTLCVRFFCTSYFEIMSPIHILPDIWAYGSVWQNDHRMRKCVVIYFTYLWAQFPSLIPYILFTVVVIFDAWSRSRGNSISSTESYFSSSFAIPRTIFFVVVVVPSFLFFVVSPNVLAICIFFVIE